MLRAVAFACLRDGEVANISAEVGNAAWSDRLHVELLVYNRHGHENAAARLNED
jgi:hypothetical protein